MGSNQREVEEVGAKWQGDVQLRRWEMPLLCEDLRNPQCNLSKLK